MVVQWHNGLLKLLTQIVLILNRWMRFLPGNCCRDWHGRLPVVKGYGHYCHGSPHVCVPDVTLALPAMVVAIYVDIVAVTKPSFEVPSVSIWFVLPDGLETCQVAKHLTLYYIAKHCPPPQWTLWSHGAQFGCVFRAANAFLPLYCPAVCIRQQPDTHAPFSPCLLT